MHSLLPLRLDSHTPFLAISARETGYDQFPKEQHECHKLFLICDIPMTIPSGIMDPSL